MNRTPPPSIEWLSANKAAELLGVTGRTVARWINEGKLRGRMTEGGRYRVTREEVDRLAAAQESRAVQPQARSAQRRKQEGRTQPTS
ncbi:MAG: excisionase family DNA-binding protein [Chloroflexi bacterium]|nr:excisionase family DNA-binding protein [Chloroflexota bacterium]MBV9132040.1 excisionase family DNA-binding protein [Chloroflexota bacterium]MBV9898394.1 excisionase family DNA-binding protein [Chloroflexota bacterium]